jgi:hypothetical protein
MLNPTKHVAKNSEPQHVCGEGPSENVILKCIDSTHHVSIKTGIQTITFNKALHKKIVLSQ